ncbi:MAG: lytic transglycosylase domain-containing protein [Deltaproteobacteria bacterium]|nr:lytic transglycosylase domain-containing protein [Deltaproteobacteria bacterium]
MASEADRLGIRRAIERGQGRLVPRQARRLAAAVVREARRRGLDPRLVAAVAIVESQFDPFAVSDQGALGVMQLMPATARELSKSPGAAVPALRERDLFDFERNLELGAAYLAGLVRQFPCLDLALWAYNAGPTAARRLSLSGQAAPPGSYPHRVRLEYRKLAGAEAEAALPAACALPPAAQGG